MGLRVLSNGTVSTTASRLCARPKVVTHARGLTIARAGICLYRAERWAKPVGSLIDQRKGVGMAIDAQGEQGTSARLAARDAAIAELSTQLRDAQARADRAEKALSETRSELVVLLRRIQELEAAMRAHADKPPVMGNPAMKTPQVPQGSWLKRTLLRLARGPSNS